MTNIQKWYTTVSAIHFLIYIHSLAVHFVMQHKPMYLKFIITNIHIFITFDTQSQDIQNIENYI